MDSEEKELNFVCPMNSCHSRQSDFSNLKIHYIRDHKKEKLRAKYLDTENQSKLMRQAEYKQKLAKLKEKQAVLAKKRQHFRIDDADEQQQQHQLNQVLRPHHTLTTANLRLCKTNLELEQAFESLHEGIGEIKRDRGVHNDINVDVMLQLVKKNVLKYDVDELTRIEDSKLKLESVRGCTRELINDLKRELDPATRRFKAQPHKPVNLKTDEHAQMYERIERDLKRHKERQEKNKEKVQGILNRSTQIAHARKLERTDEDSQSSVSNTPSPRTKFEQHSTKQHPRKQELHIHAKRGSEQDRNRYRKYLGLKAFREVPLARRSTRDASLHFRPQKDHNRNCMCSDCWYPGRDKFQ